MEGAEFFERTGSAAYYREVMSIREFKGRSIWWRMAQSVRRDVGALRLVRIRIGSSSQTLGFLTCCSTVDWVSSAFVLGNHFVSFESLMVIGLALGSVTFFEFFHIDGEAVRFESLSARPRRLGV